MTIIIIVNSSNDGGGGGSIGQFCLFHKLHKGKYLTKVECSSGIYSRMLHYPFCLFMATETNDVPILLFPGYRNLISRHLIGPLRRGWVRLKAST
jgi:hypothetical protein